MVGFDSKGGAEAQIVGFYEYLFHILEVVLLEGSPPSTDERWSSDRVTIGFLVTSLTKALLPRSLSLDGRPALGRVLVVLNLMEATVHIGTFKAAFFLYLSPDFFLKTILSRRSTDNSFDFMLGLCSDMHCQLCAFPNHVQSTEFTTDGLQT